MVLLQRSNLRRERVFWTLLSSVVLLAFLVFFLMPLVWMVITTFKPIGEMTDPNVHPFQIVNPTLENFTILVENTPFVYWVGNSVFVSVVTTLFSVTVATFAAYALVRFRFRGAQTLGLSIFVSYLVPPTLLFIPMSVVVRNLGLYNNLLSLIVVYPTIMVPFCTWLLMGFFRTIPRDMEDCARVDGASYWQAFRKIVLPVSKPGIISAAIFTFTLSWSEYLYALVLVPSRASRTLPVGVPSELQVADFYMWGSIMTAALIGSLPIALLYALSMQAFVSGLTAGAVKG
mgnify:CR=1 FL=1